MGVTTRGVWETSISPNIEEDDVCVSTSLARHQWVSTHRRARLLEAGRARYVGYLASETRTCSALPAPNVLSRTHTDEEARVGGRTAFASFHEGAERVRCRLAFRSLLFVAGRSLGRWLVDEYSN